MKTQLTVKARIILMLISWLPNWTRKKSRRKTIQWPIEKVIYILRTLPIEYIAWKFKLQITWLEPQNKENVRYVIKNIESQIRGYSRLAKQKGWIK